MPENANVYEYAEEFVMALRLRRSGVYLPDVESLFSEILYGLVRLGTRLLYRECPEYSQHKAFLISPDVQSTVMLAVLEGLEKKELSTKKSRSLLNYVIKTTQNRLKNAVRDNSRLKVRNSITFSDLGMDPDCLGSCQDLNGIRRRSYKSGRVYNENKHDDSLNNNR